MGIQKGKTKTDASPQQPVRKKRKYVSQSEVPKMTLSDALLLANALRDDFASSPTPPHSLAIAVDISPTSSNWQNICGASIAYGLTSGGYNASMISLTDLGRRIVSPTKENDENIALVEAALQPKVMREFFTRYDKSKFPQSKIARNVLLEMGVPQERVDDTLKIINENGKTVGIIIETKTGPYIALENRDKVVGMKATGPDDISLLSDQSIGLNDVGGSIAKPPMTSEPAAVDEIEKRRVFIAHGKNKDVVEQLKKILQFGKFEPVVAVEHQTTAIPVPEKVLNDMRTCFAGILHLCSEEELLDHDHNVVHRLNENVLIEIGAAMALYANNFILLCEKGIHVPSNLQGLQRCEYDGTKLDVDATMKLLAAFNEFK